MGELVRQTVAENIAVLTIDNPPVNALSPGVPEGIERGLEEALADAGVDAIIITGAGRSFIAGADIRELQKLASGATKRSPRLKELLLALEDSPKPVVAAMHGSALGGGLELAMACHYRVAAPGTKVGQPEVKLGIIPGAAGTQRLPRLIGVVRAAKMCAVGESISAEEALSLGLIDAVIEGDLVAGAIRFLKEGRLQSPPKTRNRNVPTTAGEDVEGALASLRGAIQTKQKEASAALAAIDAVAFSASSSFAAGCQREEELFQSCLYSPQAQARMHLFFGEREVAKIPDVPRDTAVLPVQRTAVIGAGTMGAGIATALAAAGFEVLLFDADAVALERGWTTAQQNLERLAPRRGWSADATRKTRERLQRCADLSAVGDVDLVIEAIFEKMTLKEEMFRALDRICKPGCILASNTSTLSIDQIAAATSRPASVVGLHFFSPAHVMRLLEIVRGAETGKEVLATALALAQKIGKLGVVAGNCRGFIGNRMYGPYQREAQFLVEEGAPPEQVDRVMEEFGMAMGPLAVGDLAGLDIGWRVRQEADHLIPKEWRRPRIADRLCELGRFGQKTGGGWYLYPEGAKRRESDPDVSAIIEEVAHERDITRRPIGADEIRDRLILGLVIEGLRILDEGFAYRPVDIDVVYVFGYGFPVWRGGPMWHAESIGWLTILDRALEWEQTQGPWWKPPRLLAELAAGTRSLREGWPRA